MTTFLVSDGIEYTYKDLLDKVNSSENYCPIFKTNNLFDFFVNIIVALSSNKDIWLLDSDINDFELGEMDFHKINSLEQTVKPFYVSIDQLNNSILNSKSKLYLFTSGTTGQPKKISHYIENLLRSVKIYLDITPKVWAFAYNPSHMAGIQVFFQTLLNKNTIVNVFNLNRDKVLKLINEFNVTNISATPTFYRLLLPYERSYESVKMITFGGEKSDDNLYNKILTIFPNAQIRNIYASTEAGALLSTKNDAFFIPKDKSNLIKIVDNELLIHKLLIGESVSLKLVDDYYHSGDLVEWVEESNKELFRFKARKNESINIGGYKVNPSEIESILCEIEGVQNSIVYGKSNSVLGYILCAEVIVADKEKVSELIIKNHLKEKLQNYKIPRIIKFVDNFSMTRTGKIKRI